MNMPASNPRFILMDRFFQMVKRSDFESQDDESHVQDLQWKPWTEQKVKKEDIETFLK